MTTGAPDPFVDEAPPGPQPFAVGFRRSSGEALVYGGLLAGAGLLIPGIAFGHQLLSAFAIVPLLVAFWHYPMIDRGYPQLGASAEGLFVERIGFIDWASIRSLELRRTAVRNIELITLAVSLTRPVEEAVSKPQAFPLWKSIMMRNWSARAQPDGNALLLVRLDTLAGSAEDILSRLRTYRQV